MQPGFRLRMATRLCWQTPRAERAHGYVNDGVCVTVSTPLIGLATLRISARMRLRLRTVGSVYLLLGRAMTRRERGRNYDEFEGWNPRAETLTGHVLTAHEPEPALLRRGVQVGKGAARGLERRRAAGVGAGGFERDVP
jgi:hypothetical protein